jgi:hypothetical protein
MLSNATVEDLIDNYINGPRRLSARRLCYLSIIKRREEMTLIGSYDILIFLPHFLGDGVAIHQISNLFFALLGGTANPGEALRNDVQLMDLLETEWASRWAAVGVQGDVIPIPAEARLPSPSTKFQQAVAKVDFKESQTRFVVSSQAHVFCLSVSLKIIFA